MSGVKDSREYVEFAANDPARYGATNTRLMLLRLLSRAEAAEAALTTARADALREAASCAKTLPGYMQPRDAAILAILALIPQEPPHAR